MRPQPKRTWGDAPGMIVRGDLYGQQIWQWQCRVVEGCEFADAGTHTEALTALADHQRAVHADTCPVRGA